MENNKGFTLIETLAIIIVISLTGLIVARYIGKTLSIGKDESYKIMKNNILSASKDYITECKNNVIECNIDFNRIIEFKAETLKDVGYFNNLNSPIDNKYLGNCLIIKATLENEKIKVDLHDECY